LGGGMGRFGGFGIFPHIQNPRLLNLLTQDCNIPFFNHLKLFFT